jgi:CheY-like chemotaxis protein
MVAHLSLINISPYVLVRQTMGRPDGRSVLVVEDEPLLAIQLQTVLTERGYRVVGPASEMSEALQLVAAVRPDVAVVDILLRGEACTALMEQLVTLKLPTVLTTGADRRLLPVVFLGHPWLDKPFGTDQLLEVLERLADRVSAPL